MDYSEWFYEVEDRKVEMNPGYGRFHYRIGDGFQKSMGSPIKKVKVHIMRFYFYIPI